MSDSLPSDGPLLLVLQDQLLPVTQIPEKSTGQKQASTACFISTKCRQPVAQSPRSVDGKKTVHQ